MTPAQLRSFLANLEKPSGVNDCWTWRGGVNTDGYASSAFDRDVYEALVAPIHPPSLQVDHLCRVRACMNPHHMELVTRIENMRRSRTCWMWQPIHYCRKGHPLTGRNRKIYSGGPSRRKEIRCYTCHAKLTEVQVIRRVA